MFTNTKSLLVAVVIIAIVVVVLALSKQEKPVVEPATVAVPAEIVAEVPAGETVPVPTEVVPAPVVTPE